MHCGRTLSITHRRHRGVTIAIYVCASSYLFFASVKVNRHFCFRASPLGRVATPSPEIITMRQRTTTIDAYANEGKRFLGFVLLRWPASGSCGRLRLQVSQIYDIVMMTLANLVGRVTHCKSPLTYTQIGSKILEPFWEIPF